jgi:hypothetical protein
MTLIAQEWGNIVTPDMIGFVEVMAFVASAGVGNARWQVNVVQSALYVVGISLSGYSPFKRDKNGLYSERQGK